MQLWGRKFNKIRNSSSPPHWDFRPANGEQTRLKVPTAHQDSSHCLFHLHGDVPPRRERAQLYSWCSTPESPSPSLSPPRPVRHQHPLSSYSCLLLVCARVSVCVSVPVSQRASSSSAAPGTLAPLSTGETALLTRRIQGTCGWVAMNFKRSFVSVLSLWLFCNWVLPVSKRCVYWKATLQLHNVLSLSGFSHFIDSINFK